jgi:hypothetical protein
MFMLVVPLSFDDKFILADIVRCKLAFEKIILFSNRWTAS